MTTPAWWSRGPRGTSILADTGAPASGLGADGDVYLRTSNGDVYKKTAGTWSVTGNIKGPAGETPTVIDGGTP